MKPSERIKEIAYGLNNNFAERETIFAMMKYLDEQWAKEQVKECPYVDCEHCKKEERERIRIIIKNKALSYKYPLGADFIAVQALEELQSEI